MERPERRPIGFHFEQIDDTFEDISVEALRAEKERLTQPLLSRAGIIDLNGAFNAVYPSLSPKTKDAIGTFPDIDKNYLGIFLYTLTGRTLEALGKKEYQDPVNNTHTHSMYPVTEGGLISQIAHTPLFDRLFHVRQLGPSSAYPIPSDHTRGEHSVFVTVDMVRTIQSLANAQPDVLAQTLRRDFQKENIGVDSKSNEEVLEIATDLAVAMGMLHDIATPAGGDTFKYAVGLHEEQDLPWMFSEGREIFGEKIDEIVELLRGRGFDERHLSYIFRCIKGESDTVLGNLISSTSDELDADRKGYTLLDSQVSGLLGGEIPAMPLPESIAVDASLSGFLELTLAELIIINYPIRLELMRNYPQLTFPPTNFLDTSEDYRLNSEGKLVCMRPDKLAWVAAFRIWNIGSHYASPMMLGLEWELQEILKRLTEEGKLHYLLTREKLLGMTDEELYEELSREPDPELQKYLRKRNSIDHKYQSIYLDMDGRQRPSNPQLSTEKEFPIRIKTGLQSRVINKDGQELSLQEYIETNPEESSSEWIRLGIMQFQNKRLAILKDDSAISLLDDDYFQREQVIHGKSPLDILDE